MPPLDPGVLLVNKSVPRPPIHRGNVTPSAREAHDGSCAKLANLSLYARMPTFPPSALPPPESPSPDWWQFRFAG